MQLKNLFQHALQNPFVLATAIAAFLHSTWTVSTFFGGKSPEVAFTPDYAGWLIPGLLLAFSLDIGLLIVANKLARGENVRGLRVTFFALAAFMYFLQWAFIIHHIPSLELSDGVRAEWQPAVTLLRDMAVWILPALLPASVTLYTFSSGEQPAGIVTPIQHQEAETIRPMQPLPSNEPMAAASPNGHAKTATANTADKS